MPFLHFILLHCTHTYARWFSERRGMSFSFAQRQRDMKLPRPRLGHNWIVPQRPNEILLVSLLGSGGSLKPSLCFSLKVELVMLFKGIKMSYVLVWLVLCNHSDTQKIQLCSLQTWVTDWRFDWRARGIMESHKTLSFILVYLLHTKHITGKFAYQRTEAYRMQWWEGSKNYKERILIFIQIKVVTSKCNIYVYYLLVSHKRV